MPSHRHLDDDGEDEFDSEAEYEEYDAEDDEEPTIPCPYCGEEIHEDAQRCPHCEQYISEEDAPMTRKPWWIVVGVLACLYMVYRWTFG